MPRYLKTTETIRFEAADGVATITLARPEQHNALSARLVGELHDALLEADARTDVNVMLLQGDGKSFCAGYDLTDVYRESAEEGAEQAHASAYRSFNATVDDDCWTMEQTQRQLAIIPALHKPVIAKIHGNCLAGGTDLAFACDIVLAADDCRIGFPAVRANGTPPTNFWMYHCGPQWTKRLLLTGDIILGRDAARIGLVLDSYKPEELDAETERLARRIALIDAELLAAQKRVVNLAMELAGAQTLQRLALEIDARAHLSRGPRRTRFREDMAGPGLRKALKNRDQDFGDSVIRLRYNEG